ncbi:hypothetical protein [Haloarchaeobius amylolyticus]|uniref:hypothetical protein n=1 Tax=Haloarchaeobius amylolyticus TaxID=1198296 RepID=UPI00226DFA80|nr:hypothetical protein [Haloarchaeobius amylolyticus]
MAGLLASVVIVLLMSPLVVFGLASAAEGVGQLRAVRHALTREPADLLTGNPTGEYVAVVGEAETYEETLQAPITATECLTYEVDVLQEKTTDYIPILDEYQRARRETVPAPFLVRTEQGQRLLVDPTDADCRLDGESVPLPSGREPPARIASFLEEQDLSDESEVDLAGYEMDAETYGLDRKFHEKRLDVGEQVLVLGRLDREGGTGAVSGTITDGGDDRFVVADTSQRWAAMRLAKTAVFYTLGGLLLALAAAWTAAYLLVPGLVPP